MTISSSFFQQLELRTTNLFDVPRPLSIGGPDVSGCSKKLLDTTPTSFASKKSITLSFSGNLWPVSDTSDTSYPSPIRRASTWPTIRVRTVAPSSTSRTSSTCSISTKESSKFGGCKPIRYFNIQF